MLEQCKECGSVAEVKFVQPRGLKVGRRLPAAKQRVPSRCSNKECPMSNPMKATLDNFRPVD